MPFSREKRKVRRGRSETSCTVVILIEASNIPSIPVVGLGPHGQLAEVGSGVVDDGLVHVVPEAETLGLGTSLDLLGGVKGPVAGALNAVARQRDVISYVTGREREGTYNGNVMERDGGTGSATGEFEKSRFLSRKCFIVTSYRGKYQIRKGG